ncbi:MAG: TetR/AcrR family transcriptional regulator [Anaerolineae bacterium]|nr:TetR/AcrR family transcriptional regulator [Anaerolineae bacterium]
MAETSREIERIAQRERKKRENRERIRQAALELFRRKGFTATTVEEITTAAAVAKGTFFNYFPTKEAVILDLGERQLGRLPVSIIGSQQMGRERSNAGASGLTATERIRTLLRALAEGLEADRDLVRQALCEAMRVPDLLSPEKGRFSLHSVLAILIAQGQRAGEFHPGVPAEAIASALEALYFQQLYLWASAPEPSSLTDRLQWAFALLVNGIGQPAPARETA